MLPLSYIPGHSFKEPIQIAKRFMIKCSAPLIIRKAQIRTTGYITPHLWVNMTNSQKNKRNTCTLLVGVYFNAGTMKKHCLRFLTFKNWTTMQSSHLNSGYVYKKIKIIISKRYQHSHAYYSFIHNTQDKEAKCPLRDKWMKKM